MVSSCDLSIAESAPQQSGQATQAMPIRNYPQVPRHLAAMFPDIERRHFNKIREFYFQQSERLSAFQYVRQQNIEKANKR